MGGLISFNLAADNPGLFAGNILISPAFANGMKFPLREYIDAFTSFLYNPKKQLPMPFTAEMCTRDVEYQKKMNADPREIRVASPKLLITILLEQIRARSLTPHTPSLFLIAGKDYLVDESAGRKLFAKLKLSDKKLIEYPDMLHALSIDLGREKVFTDIMNWLDGRI
jgi:alpha-beta hydrolase superfamily lysophospholipase